VRQFSLNPIDRATLVSFDGGIAQPVLYQRPDRYRLIQSDLSRRPRIVRGGGYSYAAASFGAGSVVQDVRRFNRLLRFDPTARIVEVEAAVTLADLLTITSRAGLCLPVQPGYPAITIGGCIAANVHGKNPSREGTFAGSLIDLTFFHPDHGVVRVSRENSPGLFDLTCGGYGLTGVILAATLRLEPLAGDRVSIRRTRVANPLEAVAVARDLAGDSLFAYTWHDAAPRARSFGRGFVYHGILKSGPIEAANVVPRYRVLTSAARARLPFSLWQPLTIRAFTSAFWHAEASRPEVTESTLFDAIFPFARRSVYFRLFGRPGLAEYQALIPHDGTETFLHELRHLILSTSAPAIMLSVKAFKGAQRLLRFDGDGICVTLDLQRSATTLDLLRQIDNLTIAVGGIPNIIKDSRLPKPVVQACYPEYERFRQELCAFDPQRVFKSELSERLAL
jgi:decaprenylphospho-beta-D-ribofuranose 2-oxidase